MSNSPSVLIVSTEPALHRDQPSLDGHVPVAELFAEVHILALQNGAAPAHEVKRIAPQVWRHQVSAPTVPSAAVAAWRAATQQLQFAGRFRPDMIIARDTGATALLAAQLGRRYDRPTQLHLTTPAFAPVAWWQGLAPAIPESLFSSLRTATSVPATQRRRLQAGADYAVLPRYFAADTLSVAPAAPLSTTYRPLTFFFTSADPLTHDSALFTILPALTAVFQTAPQCGFLVLGQGPARAELVALVSALGLTRHVVFAPPTDDIVPYLRASDVLFVSTTTAESEQLVLQAALVGTPQILTRTPWRTDLLVHQSSALFCDMTNPAEIQAAATLLHAHPTVRQHLAAAAYACVEACVHTDIDSYRRAYRQSVLAAIDQYPRPPAAA